MYPILFMHSSVDRHLGWTDVLIGVANAAVYVPHREGFCGCVFSFLLDINLDVEFLSHSNLAYTLFFIAF